jgi:alpha-L-fucosidase
LLSNLNRLTPSDYERRKLSRDRAGAGESNKCSPHSLRILPTCILGCAISLSGALQAQNFVDLKPSPPQIEWQDLEFGVIVHFSTNTFLNREWGDGTADPKVFNPSQVDPEQWLRAAKAAGAKYVVLVAKHHDGFCLWPTAQTSYSVKNSPWKVGKGDLVRETADAAHKLGLKFGVYLSPWDRHEPKYKIPAEYDKYYLAELDELAQNYGD